MRYIKGDYWISTVTRSGGWTLAMATKWGFASQPLDRPAETMWLEVGADELDACARLEKSLGLTGKAPIREFEEPQHARP